MDGSSKKSRWAQDSAQPPQQQQPQDSAVGAAESGRVLTIEVEALVLTKIMRHCRQAYPNAVNGLLIGLERGNVMEITDAVELLSKTELTAQVMSEKAVAKSVEERVTQEEARFQNRAMDALQAANGDCSNPGWYQTLTIRDMHDTDIVDGLLEYQEHSSSALVIGFDPSISGIAAFRTFRLAQDALAILQARRAVVDAPNAGLKELLGRSLLEEVPLVAKNSLLAQAFLVDWLTVNKQQVIRDEFEILARDSQAPLMAQNIEFLQRCLDDMSLEEDSLMRALKDNARASQKHRENCERRRIENEQRRLKNEPLLPDLPPFQPQPLPPQLAIQFCANNSRRTAKSIAKIVADDVCRSYLLPQLGDRK